MIEPLNYQFETLFTRSETSHHAKAYGKLLFRDTTSLTGMAISLWFSSTSRPRSTNVNPTITRVACPPQNFSSSPYSCRRPLVSHLLKRKLGQLVDFFMSGPLRCQRPNFKRGYPNPFLQKPKSALIYSWSIFNQFLFHLSAPLDHGRQMNNNVSVLLWMIKNYLRTLPLDSRRSFDHDFNCLKKNGILFPSPLSRWCDYCHQRSFNCLSPTNLITNFKQSSIINNVKTQSSRDFKEILRFF